MATLFITARWPHPLATFSNGTALRMRAILRGLQTFAGGLDMLMFAPAQQGLNSGVGEEIKADLLRLWGVRVNRLRLVNKAAVDDRPSELWRGYIRPMLGLHLQPEFARVSGTAQLQALGQLVDEWKPECLFVHRLNCMLSVMRSGVQTPALLDLDDVEHKTFRRLLNIPPEWRAQHLKWGWLPALESGERLAVHRAQACFVCSALDRDYLRRRFGSRTVHVLPNAMPVPVRTPLPSQASVLYLGLMTYAPNLQGAEYLLREIWPRVRAQYPQALLRIAGNGCERIEGYRHPPAGVEFLGFVPDLRALYAESRVALAPILTGGGTRVKIIEAALHGRPVVSTSLGAEGLDLSADRGELLIADDGPAFARAIVGLLRDDALATRVGAAGFEVCKDLYGEDVVQRIIGEHLQALLQRQDLA
jgi:glycosyltransferase involved in cell wall biosynthesis